MSQIASNATAPATRALYVAWQDQKSRRYFPVGRLTYRGAGASPAFTFCYLHGVQEAKQSGFAGFPEFPDERRTYRSNTLFSTFSNRLMARSRPDFGMYVNRLGLPTSADPLDILARSGGRRATDDIELFHAPHQAADGCYETYFLVHGIRYLPEACHNRIASLKQQETLLLMADFQNPHDEMALALRSLDRFIVGYLPRYLCPDSWTLIQECSQIEIDVQQVNMPPAPLQQRLLCRMKSCWPQGFTPFSTAEFTPFDAT